VAVTWVHSSTGVKLPIRRMADALADINRKRADADRVLLCVDGVHAFGVEQESMAELGCDFLVAGCHKWLFGPRGTGIVWGKEKAWSGHAGIIPSFEWAALEAWMHGKTPDGLPPGPRTSPGGFHSYEHRWALAEAFRFHRKIGKARVTARIHELGTTRAATRSSQRGLRPLDDGRPPDTEHEQRGREGAEHDLVADLGTHDQSPSGSSMNMARTMRM
jgi:isopenicillin-N epimerase